MKDQDKPQDKGESRQEPTKGQGTNPANQEDENAGADVLLNTRTQRGIFGANDLDYDDLKQEEESQDDEDV
ncbi:hypothetical protein [Telluribacter humicola]|uniref:hypothetical protein n=1 Tax=Telluribacter humicola TaxID=1720261 RepID=UPI001A9702A6|nr:hypothetical protein [Telluribacter humicola]